MVALASRSPASHHIQTVYTRLLKLYPKTPIALRNWKTPWELLVAVILSARCTDARVNVITTSLFAKYPSFEDYVTADIHQFEQDIRSTGFYRTKAKHILAASKVIKKHFHGEVPRTMEELLTVPGVARKTANVVLGNAYGVVHGIAVDTHVMRLSQRLRLVDTKTIGGKHNAWITKGFSHILDYTKDADPVKIERQLMVALPQKRWLGITHLLIAHGRAVCEAKAPKCQQCVLRNICPASRI